MAPASATMMGLHRRGPCGIESFCSLECLVMHHLTDRISSSRIAYLTVTDDNHDIRRLFNRCRKRLAEVRLYRLVSDLEISFDIP
jgi:hypothetical protein